MIAPIVVAVARAVVQHSLPIGDNALFVIRSRDVFTTHHFPLLGTASSASVGAGTGVNHPGPLLFDLLAIPVTVLGATAGIALGVGLINIAAVVGIAMVGYRMRGSVGSLIATACAAVVTLTLGSAILVEPWNPHVLIVACLLLFIVAAAVSSGDIALVPALVIVGSLCLQTHLSYVVIVPVVSLAAIGMLTAVIRRRLARDPQQRPNVFAQIRRSGLLSVLAFVVLWVQPLWELASNGRDSNLARLATNGGDEPTIGVRLGLRFIASVVLLPSGWGRPAFVSAIPDTPYEPDGVTVDPSGIVGFGVALVLIVALGALLVFLGRRAWLRRDRVGLATIATFAAALFACTATFVIMPFGPLGLRAHQMRWLWALGPFLLFAIGIAAVPTLGSSERSGRRVRSVLLVLIAGLAVFNVPAFVQAVGPNSEQDAIPIARRLTEQLRHVDLGVPVVYDPTGSRFAEPYGPVVLAALQDGDEPWFVDDAYLIRQFGQSRESTGDEPLRLTVVDGYGALHPPVGAERIAFDSPLSAEEIQALGDGEAQLVESIQSSGLLLTPEGEQRVAAGTYGVPLDTVLTAESNAEFLVEFGTVAQLVADDALIIAPEDRDLYETTSGLRQRVGTDTVAVFVSPITAGTG